MIRKLSSIIMFVIFLFPFMVGGQGVAAAAEPIKIGFLGPYVGVSAKYGTDLKNGFMQALGEVNYKVAGRDIVFIPEDDELKPEVGLVKARKLVEKDQVHILAGIISSAVAYALRDYVITKNVPLVICCAGATKLTQEQRSPYIFRVSFANGQQDAAGGWYAYAKRGARKYVVIGSDYAAGHEKGAGFMKTFKLMGGEIVEEIYPPLGTSDYAPYIAKIANSVGKADHLWTFFQGSDAVRFVTQYAEYGLKEKLPIFGEAGLTDSANLPAQRDAALGIEGYLQYFETVDTPENKRFFKEYREKYKDIPGSLSEGGYVGGKAVVKALEVVKGKIEDQEAFLKALKAVKFEAPRGPFRFDDHQNVVEPVHICRVEKRGGEYLNVVIDTIPDVDQYWMPKK
jgi:branched-chain amino acid transport system substrate-binding protein